MSRMSLMGFGGDFSGSAAAVNFGLEVIDYSVSGDASFCESHMFSVRIWIGQHMYVIDRSYASFCIFHSSIKRKYPRSQIPALPLAAIEKYSYNKPSSGSDGVAASKKSGGGKDISTSDSLIKNAAEQLRMNASMANLNDKEGGGGDDDSIITNDINNNLEKQKNDLKSKYGKPHKVDASEVISQKKGPLSRYLNDLLQLAEIVSSTDLMWFLDAESDIGLNKDTGAVDGMQASEESILLQGEEYSVKSVANNLVIPFNVDGGNVVVWQFKTKSYDIAFSLVFNDQEVLPYQRYNSHLGIIRGSMAFKGPGKVVITFDNSYSLMRSKRLRYVIKVFNNSEYEAAKILFGDYMKEKQKYIHQRQLLNKVLLHQSKATISSRQNDLSTFSLHTPEMVAASIIERESLYGILEQDQASDEFTRLENEKRSLQLAMQQSEKALIEERKTAARYIDKFEVILAEKDSLSAELVQMKKIGEEIKLTLEEDVQRLVIANGDLTSSLQESQDKLANAKAEIARLKAYNDEKGLGLGSLLGSRDSFTTGVGGGGNALDLSSIIAATETEKNLREDLFKMDQANNKLKVEKKQLKAYALQQKTELEALKVELEETDRKYQALQAQCHELMKLNSSSVGIANGNSHPSSSISIPVVADNNDIIDSNNNNNINSSSSLSSSSVNLIDQSNSVQSLSGSMKLYFDEIVDHDNNHLNNNAPLMLNSNSNSNNLVNNPISPTKAADKKEDDVLSSSFFSKLTSASSSLSSSPLKDSGGSVSKLSSTDNFSSFEDKSKDRSSTIESGLEADKNNNILNNKNSNFNSSSLSTPSVSMSSSILSSMKNMMNLMGPSNEDGEAVVNTASSSSSSAPVNIQGSSPLCSDLYSGGSSSVGDNSNSSSNNNTSTTTTSSTVSPTSMPASSSLPLSSAAPSSKSSHRRVSTTSSSSNSDTNRRAANGNLKFGF